MKPLLIPDGSYFSGWRLGEFAPPSMARDPAGSLSSLYAANKSDAAFASFLSDEREALLQRHGRRSWPREILSHPQLAEETN